MPIFSVPIFLPPSPLLSFYPQHIRASLLDRADREEAEQAAQAQAQAQ